MTLLGRLPDYTPPTFAPLTKPPTAFPVIRPLQPNRKAEELVISNETGPRYLSFSQYWIPRHAFVTHVMDDFLAESGFDSGLANPAYWRKLR